MSVVNNHVHRLDARVDRIHASLAKDVSVSATHTPAVDPLSTSTISTLSGIARSLSMNSASGPLIKPAKLLDLLRTYERLQHDISHVHAKTGDSYVGYLAWVFAAKATVQTFALVTNSLLKQAMPLNDGIYYWNEVLGSYFYTGLYTVQTSPLRMARHIEGVYENFHDRSLSQHAAAAGLDLHPSSSLSERWNTFYNLVRESVRQQSLTRAKTTILSPFGLSRSDARQKRRKLKKLRDINACAVGLLMEEGLHFEIEDDNTNKTNINLEDWQDIVSRSTLLMQTILKRVNDINTDLTEFEDSVFAQVVNRADTVSRSFEEDQQPEDPTGHPHWVIKHLIVTLEQHLPTQQTLFEALAKQYGRPSRLIRYWLPASILMFSSSTILNILSNRRAELVTWVRELGGTTRDFWRNWVIDPLARLIGTIRHDEKSEVALMGSRSLEADLNSLERMVVDFAVDRPSATSGGNYSDAEIDIIRSGVKEGDLTPVLTAYERDLRKPFMGTVRGDLVRALLIQVQKTKVDVEVAVSGIDSMLKSQELFFGFIALTPGILVSYATLRWISSIFGSRRGIRQSKRRGESLRSLRAVDRVLTASTPTARGMLTYKDHGLLICEAEILQQRAAQVLPGVMFHEFHEDLGELLNVRTGVGRQSRVLERLRWAYGKWIY